jgi:hypothetical protein
MDPTPGPHPLAESLEPRMFLSAAQVIRNGGFEGTVAAGDWVRSGAFQADSRFTLPRSGAGYAYFANTDGTSGNNLAGSMYQQFTLPSTASSLTLNFWTRISTNETTTTAANDVMTIKVFDSTGATELQSLGSFSNLNSSTSYVQRTFALDRSLIGQTVRLVFGANTSASLPTTFRVDDVSLMAVSPATSNRVVGYLPQYRYSSFAKVDLSAVTHFNYFSITAGGDGSLSTGGVNDGNLATVVAVAHAAGDTVSITIGPQSFGTIAASAASRAAFASNIVNYALARNLDGIDIDWEPPASGTNIANYGLLIEAIYAEAHAEHMLITAAVNPIRHEIPLSAVPEMDWINVMGYDFAPANHSTYSDAINGLVGWKNYGVAANKLVLGVPFYGRQGTDWTNTTSSTYSAIASAYQTSTGALPAPDLDLAAGYYYNGVETIRKKSQYVVDNGYGGVMIWELGQDRFNAAGNYDAWSLLPAIKSVVLASPVIGTVTPSPADNAYAPVGKTQNVSVTVTINAPSSGVLQVSLVGVNATTPRDWFFVSGAGPVTRTFTLPISQSAVGSQFYEIYTQFRPGATSGPMTDLSDADALDILPYHLNWQNFPAAPATPTPAENAALSAVPSVLDWADAQYATSYDVYVDGVLRQNVTSSQWTRNITLAPNVGHTWQVVAKNTYGTASGPVWHFSYNDAPAMPVNSSPANGATGVGVTTTLSAGAFSDPDAGDTHGASQWVVRRVSDNAIVFDSGADTSNKTSITLTAGAGLAYSTAYTWQVRYRDNNGAWSAYSAATAFTTAAPPDTTPPALHTSAHDVDARQIAVTASEVLGTTVGDAFVAIDGQPSIDVGPGVVNGNTVTYTLPATLADGNYVLTIPAGAVRDAAGNPTTADATFDFFILAGDADHNRIVDFADLVALSQNYNTSGAGVTFSRGDFNYDGAVDFADMVILSQRYNTSLGAPTPPAQPAAAALVVSVDPVAPVFAAPVVGDGRVVKSAKPVFATRPIAKSAAKSGRR